MNALALLDAESLNRVASAVRDAEKGTSGEIVPCVVDNSDDYPEAIWIAGFVTAAVVAAAMETLRWTRADGQSLTLTMQATFPIVVGVAASVLVAAWRPLRRHVVGRGRRAKRAQERAMRAFIECGVFRTRERTGVLIFVSLFEGEVVVLGDEGINAKVSAADWNGVVAKVRHGLQRHDLPGGLIAAVTEVGKLLRREGFLAQADDTNELRNSVIRPTKDPLR